MPLDPSFRISRTDAGNAELSKPTNGLSIGQRRILGFLDTPQAIGPLLASRDLEPEKFERDLAKLRSLKLVDVPGMPAEPPVTIPRPGSRATHTHKHRASSTAPIGAGSAPGVSTSTGTAFADTPTLNGANAPVVLGSGPRASSPRMWILGLALVAAGALGYLMFATPSGDHATIAATTQGTVAPLMPAAQIPSPAQLATVAPTAAPVSVPAPADAVRPVAATILDGSNTNNAQRKADPLADARNDTRTDPHNGVAEAKAAPPPPVPEVVAPRPGLAASATPVQPATPPAPATAAPIQATAPAVPPTAAPVVQAAAPVVAVPVVPVVSAGSASAGRPSTASGPVNAIALAEPTLAQPPVQVAAAAPDAATAHPAAVTARPALNDLIPIVRDQPDFPREAISAGVTKGTVKAHITVDATGKVSAVSIVEAQPRRVFDRAVSQALSQWTFNPGAASRSTDVVISFDRN